MAVRRGELMEPLYKFTTTPRGDIIGRIRLSDGEWRYHFSRDCDNEDCEGATPAYPPKFRCEHWLLLSPAALRERLRVKVDRRRDH
jgi:hypothetical protein